MNHKALVIVLVLLGFMFNQPMAGERARETSVETGIPPPAIRSLFCKAVPYGVILGAGGLLFALDKDIQRESLRSSLRGNTADGFFNAVEDYGRAGPYAVSVPLLVAHGLLLKNKKSIYVAGELGGSLLLSEGVTRVVKAAFGRLRPYESQSPYKFFKGGDSFYSGHAIAAFTFSTVMAKNYPRQDLGFLGIDSEVPLIPIAAYMAAGLVGIQRIYSNNHWASDVYFGALAGYGVGTVAVHIGEKLRAGKFRLSCRPDRNGMPMLIIAIGGK
jgi:membrane-associated phospholipid phosphatase